MRPAARQRNFFDDFHQVRLVPGIAEDANAALALALRVDQTSLATLAPGFSYTPFHTMLLPATGGILVNPVRSAYQSVDLNQGCEPEEQRRGN